MTSRGYFWVMRHGETTANAERRLQGHSDAPLTARGRAEAEQAAALLAGEGIERIVASDLGRARDTAAILGARLGLEVSHDPAWREQDFGPKLEGRPYEELTERSAVSGKRSAECPELKVPQGESRQDLEARVRRGLGGLAAGGPAPLVVTHAGPIRVLLGMAPEVPPGLVHGIEVARGFIARIERRGEELQAVVVIRG